MEESYKADGVRYLGFEIMVRFTPGMDVEQIHDALEYLFCKEEGDHDCPMVYISSSGGTYEQTERWLNWCEHNEG